jgi:hypothetical protein
MANKIKEALKKAAGRSPTLAGEICSLMERRDATDLEAVTGMLLAFMIVMKDNDISKQEALALVAEYWNYLESLLDRAREEFVCHD